MLTLAESIDALIEANARVRKRSILAKLERRLQPQMAKAFREQQREFLSRLVRLKPRFESEIREAISAGEWMPMFDEAAIATLRAFADPIDSLTSKALQASMQATVAEVGVGTSFTLEHPLAVSFMRERAARQVSRINETTRDGLRSILSDAADNGWSYDRTAREIRRQYTDMSRRRARNIAVFELGDAYEAGNAIVAHSLQNAGLVMQKAWLSVGDDRVRPEHRENQAQGWIDIDDTFQSGHERPPTDPRCRCTVQYRRDPAGSRA